MQCFQILKLINVKGRKVRVVDIGAGARPKVTSVLISSAMESFGLAVPDDAKMHLFRQRLLAHSYHAHGLPFSGCHYTNSGIDPSSRWQDGFRRQHVGAALSEKPKALQMIWACLATTLDSGAMHLLRCRLAFRQMLTIDYLEHVQSSFPSLLWILRSSACAVVTSYCLCYLATLLPVGNKRESVPTAHL